MKIREYEFDGSPEEFIRVAATLRGRGNQDQTPDGQPLANHTRKENGSSSTPAGRFVTKDEATKILTRRRLSRHLDTFMGVLYRSGDDKVTSNDLRKALGFDYAADKQGADRFRGLMGAFGRRVAHDVGADVWFFDDEWNADQGQKLWRLPPSVREAIRDLGWYR